MNSYKTVLFYILSVISLGCGTTANYYSPRPITVSDTFFHSPTKMEFPVKINQLYRTRITSFNKENTNVSVEYKSTEQQDKTHFTVYIYPAGEGYDDRLYDEYLKALQAIANVENREVHAKQGVLRYVHDDHSFIGIQAKTEKLKKAAQSMLVLFECGEYFLKYRISTNQHRVDGLDSLKKNLLERFNPSFLVKQYPLIPASEIKIAPAAFADSLTLYSVLAGALKKSAWASEQVDSLERCSGFPGLYLQGHIETYQEMAKSWKNNSEGFERYPNDFFDSLIQITENGFLEEFLMDQYNMVLFVPDSIDFSFEPYYAWKEKTLPTFNLGKRYFIISYNK